MTHSSRTARHLHRGQTLIVALIILGILLIVGLVFLGIVNRTVQDSARARTRTEASELATAGVQYADVQLTNSPEGADWRGTLVAPVPDADPNFTRDPDGIFLRPATNFVTPVGLPDRGGPDGLGPFVRVPFANGRALVRVRYAPGDPNIFLARAVGPLRQPGAARAYLIIESVGRAGRVIETDPTTLQTGDPVQFRGFGSQAAFTQALAQFSARLQTADNRILTAFKSLGVTETARFITNIDRVSRPAEVGVPQNLGAQYAIQDGSNTRSVTVSQVLGVQLGTDSIENVVGTSRVFGIGGLGSLHSNADLALYGRTDLYASPTLGDGISVAGSVTGAPGASLNVSERTFNPRTQTWNPVATTTVSGDGLNSRSPAFDTLGGLLRDGTTGADGGGYARGVGYKAPPRISNVDPATGLNRYVGMTRDSGQGAGTANSGQFGHGGGVYVDNASDRQSPRTETGRQGNPGASSLVYDWLNPNAPDSRYWFGPFYVPPGSLVELRPDGFVVTRDGRSMPAERNWRTPDGTTTSLRTLRYRLGRGADRQIHVVNALTPGITDINATLSANDYSAGPVFNGVLYFAGNVRVRGTIPTDVQMTIVTDATAYLEGSVLKGTTGNQITATYDPGQGDPETVTNVGQTIARPSRSVLGVFARDYVAVNTTQFLSPAATQGAEPVAGAGAVRVRADGALTLQSEFAKAPTQTSDAYNPSAWVAYPGLYRDALSGDALNTRLLVTHATDDGAADRTFAALNVNAGALDGVDARYFFAPEPENGAFDPANPTLPLNAWGLGVENYQRAPRFESVGFVLVDPLTATFGADQIAATTAGGTGTYRLFTAGPNLLTLGPAAYNGQGTNDYLLARATLAPHDVRIEASVYAEYGSFFIIPGSWFNPNANDRRDVFLARVNDLVTSQGRPLDQARAIALDERLRDFGSRSEIPFYGEPLDVRVTVVGSVSENMPPSLGEQAEWIRKWGWIPGKLGGTGSNIPGAHVPSNYDLNTTLVVPNLVVQYDPVLAAGRANGFANLNDLSRVVRRDREGRELPPLPRLPVSPGLAFFGDLD